MLPFVITGAIAFLAGAAIGYYTSEKDKEEGEK